MAFVSQSFLRRYWWNVGCSNFGVGKSADADGGGIVGLAVVIMLL